METGDGIMFTLPTGFDTAPIIQVAMDEELAPFLQRTQEAAPAFNIGVATYHPRYYSTPNHKEIPLLLIRSRIGLVNATTALTHALAHMQPPLVISAGTAGGLHTDIQVGDIALGTTYTYTDADATAFGYTHGQVPGMPEHYTTPTPLQDAAHTTTTRYTGEGTPHHGQMLAGGSFVTAHNVADTRTTFPQALSTDMETTALAQTCHTHGIPFIAIRGISDLCGPAADQDFHLSVDIVGPRSAELALTTLTTYLSNN